MNLCSAAGVCAARRCVVLKVGGAWCTPTAARARTFDFHGRRPVRVRSLLLALLPVQRDVVLGVVGDADDEPVAFPRHDLGPWELPVHRDDALAGAQPCHVRHGHLHAHACIYIMRPCILCTST